MSDFKVMKELVKALTYIGDAIAGKTSSNTQSTSNGYDGLISYYDGETEMRTSEGINIKDNNFNKLGDFLSENLINDLNRDFGDPRFSPKFSVYTKYRDYDGEYIPCVRISYKSSVLNYTRHDANGDEELNLNFTTSDAVGSWTKDTVLTQAAEQH